MAAFSTKGMTVWLEDDDAAAVTPVNITSATPAKPTVVTLETFPAGMKVGSLVLVQATGVESLDGNTFNVSAIDATAKTITLAGSDATGENITAGTVSDVTGSFLEFCVASLDRQQEPAASISVGTTCDPQAQIAGEPSAGTVAVTGFVDYSSAGFLEFMEAVDDGKPRDLVVRLPDTAGGGTIVFHDVTASGFSETFAVNAAASWTGEFTLSTKPEYNVAQ